MESTPDAVNEAGPSDRVLLPQGPFELTEGEHERLQQAQDAVEEARGGSHRVGRPST